MYKRICVFNLHHAEYSVLVKLEKQPLKSFLLSMFHSISLCFYPELKVYKHKKGSLLCYAINSYIRTDDVSKYRLFALQIIIFK